MANMVMREIRVYAVVKGYHAYKVKPEVGDVLECHKEPLNSHDSKAVKVQTSEGRMVGHVPAKPVALNTGIYEILDTWPAFPVGW